MVVKQTPLLMQGKAKPKSNPLQDLWNQLNQKQSLQFTKASAFGAGALHSINKGYGAALDAATKAGGAAKMEAGEAGSQAAAELAQALGSQGLGNTTIAGNAGRALSIDTAKSLAAIDQAVAAQKAGILMNKAGAQAGAFGNLSSLAMEQSSAQTQLGSLMLAHLSKKKKKKGLGGILGGIAGSIFGPVGGAAGSALAGAIFPPK